MLCKYGRVLSRTVRDGKSDVGQKRLCNTGEGLTPNCLAHAEQYTHSTSTYDGATWHR